MLFDELKLLIFGFNERLRATTTLFTFHHFDQFNSHTPDLTVED
jgi:hypothetical protein